MKNKNPKDYIKLIVNYPYDNSNVTRRIKKEIRNSKNKIVKKEICTKLNNYGRLCCTDYFNQNLQKTIGYYIGKSGFTGDDIKIMLGANYSILASLYKNTENKELSFKLIYDLCIILNVQMDEFVEKLEGIF